jgi:hypothetical protein
VPCAGLAAGRGRGSLPIGSDPVGLALAGSNHPAAPGHVRHRVLLRVSGGWVTAGAVTEASPVETHDGAGGRWRRRAPEQHCRYRAAHEMFIRSVFDPPGELPIGGHGRWRHTSSGVSVATPMRRQLIDPSAPGPHVIGTGFRTSQGVFGRHRPVLRPT